MVLVSNEWQNKSEDVPKTTTTTNTTCTNTTGATATARSAEVDIDPKSDSIPDAGINFNTKNKNTSEAVAVDFTNPITVTDSSSTTSTLITTSEIPIPETAADLNQTLANDNEINEESKKINDTNSVEIGLKNKVGADEDNSESKITEIGNLFSSVKQLKEDNNLEESVLNYNNSIKIMAEFTKESALKEEMETEESQSQNLINKHNTANNKDFIESNSYQNSIYIGTDSTAAEITRRVPQQQSNRECITTQPQQEVSLSCRIMPQTLNTALQSNVHATNNANNTNNSVVAAGLQPNLLRHLALTANLARLQKVTSTDVTLLTAKQLYQSFNIIDSNNQNKNDGNLLEGITSTSVPAATYDNNEQAKICLICEGNSHPFQTRTISLTPNVECMVGRLIAKSKASENNAIFDCKVLSRKHAVIWYTSDGKFWVKDTKSSNGTFINDNKLGDEEAELHFGDIVKFGVDVLENSRKEVHGCIIACVKLYLPDGREAISIDSSTQRTQYSGEGRISFDELHRLNLYIQETSQREKVLNSKLCNIQNVLDATRKSSALCWQSMITEDQLLHRIHSLEKKLQFMEKNVPENILRNEIIKLLDEKSSYQHTAKEALRKVYQERCEAMQMLAKMESAYTQSDNECAILRDQIMNSKQTLQDVNTRLIRLETEYNEYRDESARQQQEAKDREEHRIIMLTEKLRERELECDDLKKKISELLIKRAELLEDEEQLLEKQAIEKLDAAIADDEDSDEDSDKNDGVKIEVNDDRVIGNTTKENAKEDEDMVDLDYKFVINTKKSNKRPQLASIFGDKFNGVYEIQQDKTKLEKANAFANQKQNTPPKRVKEKVVMKWLQNSDLNKNEGSFDIFKAICSENEYNDDESEECGVLDEDELKNILPKQESVSFTTYNTNSFSDFANKLKNIKQLKPDFNNDAESEAYSEGDIEDKPKSEKISEMGSEINENVGACAEEALVVKTQVLSKENNAYVLRNFNKEEVREVYDENSDSDTQQEQTKYIQQIEHEQKSPPANFKVKTQIQAFNTNPEVIATKKLDNQTKLRSSDSDNGESDSEGESITLSSPVSRTRSVTVVNVKSDTTSKHKLREHIKEYQSQVETLNRKLQKTELEAQHTLEIMQVECEDVKLKMENLDKIIDVLKNDKKELEQIVKEYQSNATKENHIQIEKELELEEDPIIKAINVTALEREEELITYKERLDEQQRENINLQNEIALLKEKCNVGTTKDLLLRQYLPYGIIVLAIIIYFLTNYY